MSGESKRQQQLMKTRENKRMYEMHTKVFVQLNNGEFDVIVEYQMLTCLCMSLSYQVSMKSEKIQNMSNSKWIEQNLDQKVLVSVVKPWNIEPPSWVKEDLRMRDVINAYWSAKSPIPFATESGLP